MIALIASDVKITGGEKTVTLRMDFNSGTTSGDNVNTRATLAFDI